MDETIFATSLDDQETDFIFDTKQMVYINDSNNSSYPNGQVSFDLAGLSNSGKFIDWRSSYIQIPLVMNMHTSGGAIADLPENVFAMSLKNHVYQLVHSLDVQLSNNSVVNLTSFSNLDINYKILNKISSEEMENLAPSILFSKDTAESISHNSAASLNGLGECNNQIDVAPFDSTNGWRYTQNKGRLDRMKWTSYDPVLAAGEASKFTNNQLAGSVGKNYCQRTGSDITYYILATLRLKDIHELFDKLPLMRGAYFRMTLNLNTNCKSTHNANGTGFLDMTVQSPNGTLPFMISPILKGFEAGQATLFEASLGIGKSLSGTFSHPTMNQCRIYASTYTLSPAYEDKYLSMVPTKKVLYNDILSFQQMNVAPQASVNWLITNGVSRARYLLLCPFISGTTNGSNPILNQSQFIAGVKAGSPMNSPFSSCPGTSAPYANISNFNVLISGSALYQSNIQYKFEQFLNENRSSLGLNGGMTTGMSSGIIGQSDFEAGYGFVYVDLSRKQSQTSDDISRSIQAVFQNNSGVSIDYYAIIGYEREITVSTSTGALVV
jgi:hypothetical protein